MKVSGQLRKMTYEVKTPVEYFLSLDEKPTPINPVLGKKLSIKFSGVITCIACGRKTKKSYDQGYCFPCARDLPENAMQYIHFLEKHIGVPIHMVSVGSDRKEILRIQTAS